VDPLRHAVEEVELLKQLSQQVQQPPAWIPRADLFAGKDTYVVRLEIPGVPRELVNVYLSSTACIVTGERRPPEPEALRPLNVEMPYGRFERHFPVPLGLKQEQLTARWTEGMLELRLILEPAAAKITAVDVL
jgi:HSP20 family protein